MSVIRAMRVSRRKRWLGRSSGWRCVRSGFAHGVEADRDRGIFRMAGDQFLAAIRAFDGIGSMRRGTFDPQIHNSVSSCAVA